MTLVAGIMMLPSEQRDERWGEERMKGLWRRGANLYTSHPKVTGLARPPSDLPFNSPVKY